MKRTALLLAVCMASQACAARTWSSSVQSPHRRGGDWTRVQAVAGGTELEVHMRVRSGPPGAFQSIRCRFGAAAADALTVIGRGGAEWTLPRRDVLVVRARRPFLKRLPGWIAFGALFGILALIDPGDTGGDHNSLPVVALYAAFPAALPFFFASGMETIYERR